MATNLATNVVAFVLVLGFLVFVHEAGHFLFAKLFRVRVFVFSFGFGRRLFGFQRGDTDYRVSLIPLGGYVRMAGDTVEEEGAGNNEGDFLAKPKWQRFLILFAGPGMNLVVAVLFLAFLFMAGTEELRDSAPVLGTILPEKPAATAGLQTGDRIVSVDGETIRNWTDFKMLVNMSPGQPLNVQIRRGEALEQVTVRPERIETDYGIIGQIGATPKIDLEVGRVLEDSAAARAGLQEGDRIVSAAGTPVGHWDQFLTVLDERKGRATPLAVERGASTVEMTLPAMRSEKESYPGLIPPIEMRRLPFGEALRESIDQNVKMTRYTFSVLARFFRWEGSAKDFSGPLTIARISGEMLRTGWRAIVFLMASISLQLAIMNLLPIPVLDGGHIFILLIESLAGRELSVTVKDRIMRVGIAMLATLMIVVLFNDVVQNVMLMRRG